MKTDAGRQANHELNTGGSEVRPEPGRTTANDAGGSEPLRLYYASDVHGADGCWRKFLRAGSFYKATASIMGGDLTGKAIVPVIREPDGTHQAHFLGEERRSRNDEELQQLLGAIRFNGMYPWVAERADVDAYAHPDRLEALFQRVLESELKRWVAIADEREDTPPGGTYVIAGNDDPWEIDEVLKESSALTFADERILDLGGRELLSLSYSNPTPWSSPRELPEDELYEKLRALAGRLERPHDAIFNLHVPPLDSGLDAAIAIDAEFRVRSSGGAQATTPVGSSAVRQIIEEVQPAVALHGHIHESRGEARLGRTLCLNPGSEYNTGRIHGVLVTLNGSSAVKHQFVIG